MTPDEQVAQMRVFIALDTATRTMQALAASPAPENALAALLVAREGEQAFEAAAHHPGALDAYLLPGAIDALRRAREAVAAATAPARD